MKEEDDKKRQVDLQREMNEQAEQMMAEQQGTVGIFITFIWTLHKS